MDVNEKVLHDILASAIARGMAKAFDGVFLLIAFVVLVQLGIHWWQGSFDKDSTDGVNRSGMSLHIDELTGCNYLSASGGGITPRLDRDGKHYGCNQ